jgi:hypothetical protein
MIGLAVFVFICLVLAGIALRARWLLKRAERDRPATLEGGGSHLSTKG